MSFALRSYDVLWILYQNLMFTDLCDARGLMVHNFTLQGLAAGNKACWESD